MISDINSCEFVSTVPHFKEDSEVESDEFMVGGVDEPDEVAAVLVPLEEPEIFVMKLFLEDDLVVVFVDIDPDGLLILNIFGDRVHSIQIFVGVAIEGDMLAHWDCEPKVFAGRFAQFEQVLVVTDVSVCIFVPQLIEFLTLFPVLDL